MVNDETAWHLMPPRAHLRGLECSFTEAWMRYGYASCDAALVYHYAMAVGLLAAVAPPGLTMSYGSAMPAHLWVLLTGKTGTRKSTAISRARKALRRLYPDLILDHPESPAALVAMLADQDPQFLGRGVLIYSEYGDFLQSTKTGSYKESLRTKLTEAYDDGGLSRKTVREQAVRVDDVRLTMLAAAADGMLEQNTKRTDWTNGYMNRHWLVRGPPSYRKDMEPPPPKARWQHLEDYAIKMLEWRSMQDAYPCIGMTADARILWNQWVEYVKAQNHTGLQEDANTRVHTIALKAAVLLAWDMGYASSGEWYMPVEIVWQAINVARVHLISVEATLDQLAFGNFATLRRDVLAALEHGGTEGDVLQRLSRTNAVPVRTLRSVLETLVTEGLIEAHSNPGTATFYSLTAIVTAFAAAHPGQHTAESQPAPAQGEQGVTEVLEWDFLTPDED